MPTPQKSAFDWQGAPSSFSSDPSFTPNKHGRSRQENAQVGVETYRQRTGGCKGAVPGLSLGPLNAPLLRPRRSNNTKGG